MHRLSLVVFVLVIGSSSPALAQSEAPEGDGGLNVCCGGMIGSVGGSGSISGTVRGPGSRTGRSAPVPAVTTNDTAPVAITEGVVEPAELKPAPEQADHSPATSRSSAPYGPLLAALIVAAAAAVLFARRRPADLG